MTSLKPVMRHRASPLSLLVGAVVAAPAIFHRSEARDDQALGTADGTSGRGGFCATHEPRRSATPSSIGTRTPRAAR